MQGEVKLINGAGIKPCPQPYCKGEKMNMNKVASKLAKSNKGKKDVSVAQVKEILKDLKIMCKRDSKALLCVVNYLLRG